MNQPIYLPVDPPTYLQTNLSTNGPTNEPTTNQHTKVATNLPTQPVKSLDTFPLAFMRKYVQTFDWTHIN